MLRQIVLLAIVVLSPVMASAAVDISGSGGCFEATRNIVSRWLEVKSVMVRGNFDLDRRVRKEDFFCVSPQYIAQAMQRRNSPGVPLRCFADPNGSVRGICCNESLNECAMIRPELAPDPERKRKRDQSYRRSNSDWVRPPSENDQWQTVDP